jgi:putative nicotinate phosphoribosyltransferase
VRRLPARRNYLLACGLDAILRYLENLHFSEEAIVYLGTLGLFSERFLDWLKKLHFTGDVFAVPEGTPVFANEPIVELVAPLPQAQLAETFIMNQVHVQTVAASKAARVVTAAQGRAVVDFGLRRMHGADAGIKAAWAFHIAGVKATSNVLAGMIYGIPVTGTMAHSYIQAHKDELEAFRAFATLYPETVLLVDTYDTLEGVQRVAALGRALNEKFRVQAIRIDSGDLADLAIHARQILDAAGLKRVDIFVSGNLDEDVIAELVRRGVPINGFGVGTEMGVSRDAPTIDIVYKLTAYAGQGRLKLSSGKSILPGRKQIFRVERDSLAVTDILAGHDEVHPGRALLQPVMKQGQRLLAGRTTLKSAQAHAAAELAKLPERIRALTPADLPYPVEVSEALKTRTQKLALLLSASRGGKSL